MKKIILSSSLAMAVLTIPALGVRAEEEPKASQKLDQQNYNDPNSTVSRAAEVYKTVLNGPHGKVPSTVLSKANCIAVFPSVITAAIGVGGSHGDGVAFCKNNTTNKWSNPIFLNLTGASIGLQAGAKSSDLVLFMSNANAEKGIREGKLSLTGELSAIAGKYDESFSLPKTGIVAYTRSEGVFAGASIGGADLSRDKDEERAFYGTQTDSIFDGKMPPKVEKSVEELRSILPS